MRLGRRCQLILLWMANIDALVKPSQGQAVAAASTERTEPRAQARSVPLDLDKVIIITAASAQQQRPSRIRVAVYIYMCELVPPNSDNQLLNTRPRIVSRLCAALPCDYKHTCVYLTSKSKYMRNEREQTLDKK